ncbi:hypothetical protein C4K25_3089 [Pseudomonas chlororaphis]|nr:hypothetical protein C4K25_3089 [Pseudomonas chlororaphis]
MHSCAWASRVGCLAIGTRSTQVRPASRQMPRVVQLDR